MTRVGKFSILAAAVSLIAIVCTYSFSTSSNSDWEATSQENILYFRRWKVCEVGMDARFVAQRMAELAPGITCSQDQMGVLVCEDHKEKIVFRLQRGKVTGVSVYHKV